MTGHYVDPQSAIAASDRDNLLVVAPPGCGKTEILAKRAAFLVGRLQPGQRILALTFSNKAQQNLRERLVRELGAVRCRRYVTVRNFHGHSAEILRAHARTIGVSPDFPLPGKRTLDTAIDPYVAGMPIGAASERRKQITTALRVVKQQPLDDSEVAIILGQGGDSVAQEIERVRHELGLMHYEDLLRHAQRLLRIGPVANLYQCHYGALLVDEFQDLSPQQLDIALRTVAGNRTFVGDPLQGIYTWAGARPDLVEAELRRLCGEPMRLTSSYRSSPAVLAVVNPVAESMGSPPLSSAHPERWCEGGASTAMVFSTEAVESDWIVNTARTILMRDRSATIGVISRERWRRKLVDHAFAVADVPSTQWDLAVEDPLILEALQAIATGLPAGASVDDLETRALVGIPAAEVDTYRDMVEAIEQLRVLAARTGSIVEAFEKVAVRDPSDAIGPGVHLLNAHTGKGQQFDWVFIPGFEGFHIPSGQSTSAEEKQEELRVLLVMLSRARHGVVLSSAQTRLSKRGSSYSVKQSEWWEWVTGACGLSWQEFEAHVARYVKPFTGE